MASRLAPSALSVSTPAEKALSPLDVITVAPGPASVVGRGLIVHVQPDDYKSQPVGNAGARMACAVIQRAATGGGTAGSGSKY